MLAGEGVLGGSFRGGKKGKILVFVTDCIHDGNAISVVVAVVSPLPIDSLSVRCIVQYHNTT